MIELSIDLLVGAAYYFCEYTADCVVGLPFFEADFCGVVDFLIF